MEFKPINTFESINTIEIRHKFLHEIEYFKEYFSFNDNKVLEREMYLTSLMNEEIKENLKDESTIRSIYYFDLIKLPSYFYHSSIVSLYSLLEMNLNTICEKVRKDIGLPIGIKDLAGQNIIQKARNYLCKLKLIDFEKIDKEWIALTNYQKLRNLIVHQNSQLLNSNDVSNSDGYSIINHFKDIELDRFTNIFYIKDKEVIVEFLLVIEKFILNILDQLNSKEVRNIEIREMIVYLESNEEFPF